MKAQIEVASRQEAKQIRAGLEDPEVRAFVRVCGILRPLKSDRARRRVLHFVAGHYEEEEQRQLQEIAALEESDG